jgi:hypothetical protein
MEEIKKQITNATKKLYYKFSDGGEYSNVVIDLDDIKSVIQAESIEEGDEDIEYIITPVWLTEDEFMDLAEVNL